MSEHVVLRKLLVWRDTGRPSRSMVDHRLLLLASRWLQRVETRAQLLVFQTVDQGVNLRAKDGQPGERNAEHRHAVSQLLQDEGGVQL